MSSKCFCFFFLGGGGGAGEERFLVGTSFLVLYRDMYILVLWTFLGPFFNPDFLGI